MGIYLKDCVDQYCNTLGVSKDRLKNAHTPFIDETKNPLCWVDEEIGGGLDWTQFTKKCLAPVRIVTPAAKRAPVTSKVKQNLKPKARFARAKPGPKGRDKPNPLSG